jgi:hypothetical protein
MAKPSRKVVLIIVEGICDEHLLTGRLKELFKESNILVEVQHGDVMYDSNDGKKTPIKSKIGNIVTRFVKARKFRDSDMLAVLHIIDTDGCLIPDSDVTVDSKIQGNTLYKPNQIVVSNDAQRNYIVSRNSERSRNIRTMNSIRKINKFPYRIYFFSRHLEHVLFNNQNPEEDGKFTAIDNFLKQLTEPVEEFLKRHMPALTPGTHEEKYKQSWVYIESGISSLQRATNVPLLIEFLEEIDK